MTTTNSLPHDLNQAVHTAIHECGEDAPFADYCDAIIQLVGLATWDDWEDAITSRLSDLV